jgi:aspartyl-tRNA(Asn)/glutamyl-tRNA(Gln) amidotransferase subunit C
MSSITSEHTQRIAHLARLELDDESEKKLTTELNAILTMIDIMNEADTTGISPMAHPLHAVQRLREDDVTEPNIKAAAQAIAPNVQDGLYVVPRVVD